MKQMNALGGSLLLIIFIEEAYPCDLETGRLEQEESEQEYETRKWEKLFS